MYNHISKFLSTRIVLQALGVVDYGIFGVIGGVINMLGFLSASMAATTQRFMSYSEGNGNFEDKSRYLMLVSYFML